MSGPVAVPRSLLGRRLPVALVLALVVALTGVSLGAAPAVAATAPITGAGSTFAQIAIDQWRRDVNRTEGLQITYSGQGSSQGRRQFIANTVDFASSDISFEPTELPVSRGFAYMPLVAGGTALMYNLKDDAGRQISNLQLSGPTIAKIFTGKIRRWDAQEIKDDNPGLVNRLPAQDIKAVVRSGGSGTSAVFTGYMAKVAPDVWSGFAAEWGITDAYTSTFPDVPGFIKQSGSDGIANFVANPNAGRGSIGYAEAGYAKQRGLPMAYVKNASGNWTLPTARAVAIALTKANRNGDGTQDLSGVYFHDHPEAYAISSYNYLIVPTADLDTAKGETLGRFIIFSITEGQAKAAQLGYSPLPPNLVQQGLDVVKQIPGAPEPPPLGNWGRFYEDLQVQAPPKQPVSPQQQQTEGGPTGGGNGGGASRSRTSGPTGAGPAASSAVGGDATTATTTEESLDDTGLDEVAAPIGRFAVDEDGNIVGEGGSATLPAAAAPTGLLLLGALLLALVLGPPVVSAVRPTRRRDGAVDP